jgi:phosphatidylglycerophosphatase A
MVSTFFYSGYVPRIPGTVGSLAGLLFFLLVNHSLTLTIVSLLVLTAAALLVIKKAEDLFGKKDSRRIVIDEVIGMMIALLFIPAKAEFVVLAFVFFRIFDILKPFPIKMAERIRSPFGVVLDDVIAGIYANLIVRAGIIVLLKERCR